MPFSLIPAAVFGGAKGFIAYIRRIMLQDGETWESTATISQNTVLLRFKHSDHDAYILHLQKLDGSPFVERFVKEVYKLN
jgi:hypothetical protein